MLVLYQLDRKASKHYLLEFGFFLLDRLNLGFLLREKLATIFIKPSLGVSQLAGHLLHQLHANKFFGTIHHRAIYSNQDIFWRRCRGKRRLLQGEFRMHIFYFVLSFALLYFYLHRFNKNPKKIVFFIVAFIYLLLVLLE
jgi:hypothetical protein